MLLRSRSGSKTAVPSPPALCPNAVFAECPAALPDDLLRAIRDRAVAAYRAKRWPYAAIAPALRTAAPTYTERATEIPMKYGRCLRRQTYWRFFDYGFDIGGVYHRILVRNLFFMESEFTLLREEATPERYFVVLGYAWHSFRDPVKHRVRLSLSALPINTAMREAVYALSVVMLRHIGDQWFTPRQRVNYYTDDGMKVFQSLRRFLYELHRPPRRGWRPLVR